MIQKYELGRSMSLTASSHAAFPSNRQSRPRAKWIASIGGLLFLWAISAATYEAAGADAESLATLRQGATERLDKDVKFLASDEMEGRGPGTQGIEKAADFIREEFKKAGLKSAVEDGSFYQPFTVPLGRSPVVEKTHLRLTGPDGETWNLELEKDVRVFFSPTNEVQDAPLVFVGYGISAPDLQYDEYAGMDIEGKFVLLIRREPQQADQESVFAGDENSPHAFFATKIKQAIAHKAAGVILVNDALSVARDNQDEFVPTSSINVSQAKLAFTHISAVAADRILQVTPLKSGDKSLASMATIEKHLDENLKPISQVLDGWRVNYAAEFVSESAQTVNVAGMLEGEGPLANETVVVGAHYDHLGFGGPGSRAPGDKSVHNGADDNASGTAAMIELARRLGKSGANRRRILFVAFSGEERGLLGSKFYAEKPLLALENTIAMFNYDMIGNLRDETVEVHGSGSGSTFDALIDKLDGDSPLKVKKSRNVFAASDHFSFYQKEIPVLFFFTGTTPIYHTPDDDYETLNIAGISKVLDFSEQVVLATLNADEKPVFQKTVDPRRGRRNVPFLGITPDYRATIGVTVKAVQPNSPADVAGIKVADLIDSIGGTKIDDVRGMIRRLSQNQTEKELTFVVVRDGAKIDLQVKLVAPGANP
jgi:hypothetical protein